MRTTQLAAMTVFAIAVTLPTPSAADVDVTTNPKSPSVVIGAEKVHGAGEPLADQAASPTRNPKAPANTITCIPSASGGCNMADGFSTLPGRPDADDPELTDGDVLRAVREIGLPSLELQIQPGEETLVNIETIFYTEPQAFERSIDLLGFDIDLSASPVSYRWVHDDGTASTTSKPGRPYPAMDVTHRYRKPDDVRPRVDVTYRVRYRVDGGAWQTIGQTLQASGPAVELDVREAAPVLTRP